MDVRRLLFPFFFMSRNAAPISYNVITLVDMVPLWSKVFMVLCSFTVVYIGVDCLSRCVISLYWPSFCVLGTCLRLFDAKIVCHMISWLYFLTSLRVFVSIVWRISAYSIQCLSPLCHLPNMIVRRCTRIVLTEDCVEYFRPAGD